MDSEAPNSDITFSNILDIISSYNKGRQSYREITNQLYRINPSYTLIINALTTFYLQHHERQDFNSKDFGDFLYLFQSNNFLRSRDIIANFDPHKLDSVGYSRGLFSIAIKEKTKKFYTLNIYNLWREHPRGFSSIYYTLCNFPNEIPFLTSKFSLCPRKILMLSLMVLSDKINHMPTEQFLQLDLFKFITNFSRELITSIVLIRSTCKTASQDHPWLYSAWWRLVAILINHDIIDWKRLYSCLSPNNEELEAINKSISEFSPKQEAPQQPNGAATSQNGNTDDNYRVFVYKGWRLRTALNGVDYDDWGFTITGSQVVESTDLDANLARFFTNSSPKFQLLGHLHSELICGGSIKSNKLPVVLNGHFNYFILQGLGLKLEKVISIPIEHINFNLILSTLSQIGPNLSLLPHQFYRLLNFLMGNSQTISQQVMDNIILNSLFPSLILSRRGNVQLGDSIWDLLSTFKSWRRYNLYSKFEKRWLKNSSNKEINSFLVCRKHTSYKKTYRSILKRVTSSLTSTSTTSSASKKTSARSTVSTVTSIGNVDPWAIVETGLFQAETFQNLIPSVVETGKYLSRLTLDIYFKYFVESLSNNSKLKVIHGDLGGRLFKRHPFTDIQPLLFCLTEKLIQANKEGTLSKNPEDILEYLSKFIIFGANLSILPPTEALTLDQILSQAGGPILAMESISIGSLKGYEPNCKGKTRLVKELDNGNLIDILRSAINKLLHEALYDWDVNSMSINKLTKFVDSLNETLRTLQELQDMPFTQMSMDGNEVWDTFEPSDVYFPETQYDSIISKLDNIYAKKKSKKYPAFRESLVNEKTSMSQHYQEVLVNKEIINAWGNGGFSAISSLVTYISRRLFLSELDCLFCSKLIWYLSREKAPGFNFWIFLDLWTKSLLFLISNTTQKEASLLALFVQILLEPLAKLTTDGDIYLSVVTDNPAFSKSLYGTKSKISKPKNNTEDTAIVTHEEFLQGMRRWEGRILRALTTPLQLLPSISDNEDSISWVESKSAVLFLSRLQGIFPTNAQVAECLQFGLANLENYARSKDWKDISVAASTLRKRPPTTLTA